MHDATKHIPSIHWSLRRTSQQRPVALLLEAVMWSRVIVIRHVRGDDPVEMPLIHNQQVVETFLPHGPDPALSERIGFRCLERCADNRNTIRGENRIKGRRELCIPVVDQEMHWYFPILNLPTELAGLLRDPRGGRGSRTASEVDPSRSKFNEKEHIDGSQPGRFHCKEVTRHDRVLVMTKEGAPRGAMLRTVRRRWHLPALAQIF